jgi:hypothetical protein
MQKIFADHSARGTEVQAPSPASGVMLEDEADERKEEE